MIYFPQDYRLSNPSALLQLTTKSMKEIIAKHLYEHTKQLKFTMSIHVVFQQATEIDNLFLMRMLV